ncbi:MAG: histidine kinase, partial [Proteobacteria bacterium]|nr:histidine kinase [Pseudomonadota bacterium]
MKEGREENPAALPESEGQFRNLSDDVAISIWNEDLSGVYDALEQLRIDGVTNLRQYLTDYPQTVWDMLAMVRVVHV